MRPEVARVARHPWTAALVMGVVISVPGWIAWQLERDERAELQGCIQSWADRSTTRSNHLAGPGQQVDDADAQLWREIAGQFRSGEADRAAFDRSLQAYLDAVDRLAAARRNNPVPITPSLVC